jgi:predicted anti-sigma-YlaC factor YlaD
MNCRTFAENAAAAADRQLPPELQAAAEAHLAACTACRTERDRQNAVRQLVRRRAPRPAVPDRVREELLRRLSTRSRSTGAWPRRALLVGSIAAALLLGVAVLLRQPAPSLLAVARSDVDAAEAGTLPLAMRTGDAAALGGYYRRAGITFDHSVENFASKGLHLVGGDVSSIGRVMTTRTLYEGPRGKVVCRRFRDGSVELPDGGEQIGATRVLTREGIQLEITHIGDVVCTMASRTTVTAAAALHTLVRHHD